MSKNSLGEQLESCKLGDLVCCMWTDVNNGKTSTNGGVIDVPVRGWGIFVGVFGKSKHIIFAQNNFRYAMGLLDLDYNRLFRKSYDNESIVFLSTKQTGIKHD